MIFIIKYHYHIKLKLKNRAEIFKEVSNSLLFILFGIHY